MFDVMDQLQSQLVDRAQGGAGGGKSRLTDEGRLLLQRYDDYSAALREQAGLLFDRYFGDMF